MNLQQFREQYPQYDDLDNDAVKANLYDSYKDTMSYEDFDTKFDPPQVSPVSTESDKGFVIQESPTPQPVPEVGVVDYEPPPDSDITPVESLAGDMGRYLTREPSGDPRYSGQVAPTEDESAQTLGTPLRLAAGLAEDATYLSTQIPYQIGRGVDKLEQITSGKYVQDKPAEQSFITGKLKTLADAGVRASDRFGAVKAKYNPDPSPVADEAISFVAGGVGGLAKRALAKGGRAKLKDKAAQKLQDAAKLAYADEAASTTFARSGSVALASDIAIVDPITETIYENVDSSDMTDNEKTAAKILAPLIIGFATGTAVENKFEIALGEPQVRKVIKEFAGGEIDVAEVNARLKNVTIDPDSRTPEDITDMLKKQPTLTKSIAEEEQDFSNVRELGIAPNTFRTFVGSEAEVGWNPNKVLKAENMEKSGKTKAEIWKETGMGRDPGGEWFFEISDDEAKFAKGFNAKIKSKGMAGLKGENLEDIYDHPKLYEAYPWAKDIQVDIRITPGLPENRARGSHQYVGGKKSNIVVVAGDAKKAREVLTHEINHHAQKIEDFAVGGNSRLMAKVVNANIKHAKDWRTALKDPGLPEDMKPLGRAELARTKKTLQDMGVTPSLVELKHAQITYHKAQRDYLKAKDAAKANGNLANKNELAKARTYANSTVDNVNQKKSNYDDAIFKAYKNLGGEVMSREAGSRMEWSPEMRRDAVPVPGSNTFVLKKGKSGSPNIADRVKVEKEAPSLKPEKPVVPKTAKKPKWVGEGESPQQRWNREQSERRAQERIDSEAVPPNTRVAPFISVHPSVITSPMGVTAGISIDDETGEVHFNPQLALMGIMVGGLGGEGMKAVRLFADDYTAWSRTLWDSTRDSASGKITNEWLRRQMGLGREVELKEYFRAYERDTRVLMKKAMVLGQEILKLAPTKLEQRRLFQIMKGGIHSNPELVAKALQVNKMFEEYRGMLKEYNILNYSRFDKLTKKQRSGLKRVIDDPASTTEEVEQAINELQNYYKIGSSREYMPIFYNKHEGFTTLEKNALQDEIDYLKKRSRYDNPAGNPDMEATIAELEDALKVGTKRIVNPNRLKLNRGYAQQRQDIPAEILRMLNPLNEAPYSAAKGVAVQGTDILKEKLFHQIGKNPNWVKEFKKGGAPIPANYVKVGDPSLGSLAGKYVRNDIHADLLEAFQPKDLGIRTYDSMMGGWKFGKAILNPVTHVRNFTSNAVLAYFGDVNPLDAITYGQATKALVGRESDVFYKEASDWGLFNNSFVATELSSFKNGLNTLREPEAVTSLIKKIANAPATLYDKNEQLFKMAVYIKARKGGKSVNDAASKAEEFLFNYRDIPPWVATYKRWLSPFFTYTYKAVPTIAKTMITKPWKFGVLGASAYGANEYAHNRLGTTTGESKRERDLLPSADNALSTYTDKFIVLMPFRSNEGDNQYFDLNNFMPWGSMGRTWGQSNVPLGDWMPSSPLFELAGSLKFNQNSFTGKEIWDEILDSNLKAMTKYGGFAWDQLAPPLVAQSGRKLATGFSNSFMDGTEEQWDGSQMSMSEAVASTIFGVKLNKANLEAMNNFTSFRLKEIEQSVMKKTGKLKRDFKRGKIDRDTYKVEIEALTEINIQLQSQIAKEYEGE